MLYTLTIVTALLFIAHVVLLLASFSRSGFSNRRYFYSHLTLWLTGLSVFFLAFKFSGTHASGFLDYFNTPSKLAMILGFTLVLSVIAHGVVKGLVLPALQKK